MHGTDPTIQAAAAVWLDEPRARVPAVAGSKAANLAQARAAGLPTLDGFVIPTTTTASGGASLALELEGVRADWSRLSEGGARSLVVRSSSVGEDTGSSSMAGRFTSVLRVVGWEAFVDAVEEVLASAGAVAADAGEGTAAPMAVLVQSHCEARIGGVLFGLDPLTGDRRSLLVSMVAGPPEDIVSGAVDGTTVVLSGRGRVLRNDGALPEGFGAELRRGLVRLATTAEAHFGGPQDIEWLVDPDGALVLLQSRPVTASAVPAPRSHLLGPGPVAETFPDPLSRLERDLWLGALEEGIGEALRIGGARRQPGPVVVAVGGRVAVDLERLGVVPGRRHAFSALDPRPGLRRLRAAWRLGRLRRALPAIAADVVEETDAALRAVPAPEVLDDHELVTVLGNARRTLAGLHAHEVLAGQFLDPAAAAPTAASLALAELERGRLEGLDDAAIVARSPVVLALVAPRIDQTGAVGRISRMRTPAGVPGPEATSAAQTHEHNRTEPDPAALAREVLRLRVRWVQELQVRVAMELGRRLVARGQLDAGGRSPAAVRDVPLDELLAAVDDPSRHARVDPTEEGEAPLPARFRLSSDGAVVPEVAEGGGATGVSPGRARAAVTHDPADAAGHVLVVPALAPELAPVLGSVAAVVAESGSPLSHLAILAREQSVPAVVGMARATEVLHDGDVVLVDGATGEVSVP